MLKHGFYLSFGKSVLHNLSLQSILKEIPIDKIFLETDMMQIFDIEELYQKQLKLKKFQLEDLQNKILYNINVRVFTYKNINLTDRLVTTFRIINKTMKVEKLRKKPNVLVVGLVE